MMIIKILLISLIAPFFFTPLYADKSALKILFVVEVFPYALQTFIINQIKGLCDRGHDVSILARKPLDAVLPADLSHYNWDNKIFYEHLPHDVRNYDVILCQFANLALPENLLQQQEGLQGKLVVFYRGSDIRITRQEVFDKADLIAPVCHAFKNRLITAGCPEHKIVVVRSSINCSRFTFRPTLAPLPDEKIKIITISRLVPKKGIGLALKVIASLLKTHKNIEYTIVGDGNQRAFLENLVRILKIGDRVKLLGKKPHHEVAQLLSTSHIFLLPSMSSGNNVEGIPNAIKEAMATGLPVISTYHSGIPEIVIDGESGLLVPEKDAKTLAQKIEYLLNHSEQWEAMGRAGRLKIEEEYEMECENDRLEAMLFDLVAKG